MPSVGDARLRDPTGGRDLRPDPVPPPGRDHRPYRVGAVSGDDRGMDTHADSSLHDSADTSAPIDTEMPRVIVEGEDDAIRDSVIDLLGFSGFTVVDCECSDAGKYHPLALADPEERVGRRDVIFFSFREVSPRRREAFKAMRKCHPKNPIVIELMQPKTFRYMDLLLGTTLVTAPVSGDSLREAVMTAWNAPNPIIATLRR